MNAEQYKRGEDRRHDHVGHELSGLPRLGIRRPGKSRRCGTRVRGDSRGKAANAHGGKKPSRSGSSWRRLTSPTRQRGLIREGAIPREGIAARTEQASTESRSLAPARAKAASGTTCSPERRMRPEKRPIRNPSARFSVSRPENVNVTASYLLLASRRIIRIESNVFRRKITRPEPHRLGARLEPQAQ
jgi:hypothetical protein